MSDVFGPFVHGGDVEQAARDTLRMWFATYLREAERAAGRTQLSLRAPRSYYVTGDQRDQRWPDRQLPAVILWSPGLAERPTRLGSGVWRARWTLVAGVMVAGATEEGTRELTHIYGQCAMGILAQQPLPAPAGGAVLMDLSYDDGPEQSSRSLAYAAVEFHIDVDEALDDSKGPLEPDPDADPVGPAYPEIETADVDVNPVEETP